MKRFWCLFLIAILLLACGTEPDAPIVEIDPATDTAAPARTAIPETPEPTPDPDRLMVALTFDDGPNPNNTGRILDILEQNGVKATFFVLGTSISDNTAFQLQRMVDLGCEIGIHGQDHSNLTNMSYESQIRRHSNMKQILSERLGSDFTPKLMRPPGGNYGSDTLKAAKDSGLAVIIWSVDTLDWQNWSKETILSICRKQIKNGSIVLFHDKIGATVQAVEELVPWLKEQGYELVTVSELLESRGEPAEPGKLYFCKSFD